MLCSEENGGKVKDAVRANGEGVVLSLQGNTRRLEEAVKRFPTKVWVDSGQQMATTPSPKVLRVCISQRLSNEDGQEDPPRGVELEKPGKKHTAMSEKRAG